MPFLTSKDIEESFFPSERFAPDANSYPLPSGKEYHGHRPVSGLPTGWKPRKQMEQAHFYYYQLQADGSISARVYTIDIATGSIDDFRGHIRTWISDSSGSDPAFKGSDPEAVEWTCPCFVIIYMDNSGWSFVDQPGDAAKNDSLHFFKDTSNPRIKRIGNGSFFNSRSYDFDRGKGETARCLVVENHHFKGPNGKPRRNGDPEDAFKYDIFFRVKLNTPNESDKELVLVIDPGGKNTGPGGNV